MAKDYNIDDILSEVNSRKREEKEQEATGFIDEVKPEPVVEDIEPAEEKDEIIDIYSNPTPDAEPQDEPQEVALDEILEQNSEAPEEYPEKYPEENEAIDISRFAVSNVEEEEKPKKEKKNKKGKKIFVAIICIVLALAIALGVGGWLYVNKMLDKVSTAPTQEVEEVWTGMDVLSESFDPIDEADASEVGSLKDMIKQWYYNGTPCSSTHVLNIMLVGEDGYEYETEESRADSAIIASVNIDTNTITLTSILRDTYAYWETEPGNPDSGEFGKINGAKSSGDIHTYINAVEHLYKVKIDNYVTVDFESFKTIVDTLGGVDLEITDAEINEINNDQLTYDGTYIDKTFEGSEGVMRLTGQQALSYCRIRHLDSDNVRADRQKKCLNAIFKGLKDASNIKLLRVLNDIVPYVTTDMPKDNILKVARYALSKGWMQYEIVMNTVPNSRINERGAGGIYYGAWCWKADFPQDAYNLQMLMYGKSNITLARTRVDILRCRETGYFADGSGPVTATITNNHYGEVTTLESTTSAGIKE